MYDLPVLSLRPLALSAALLASAPAAAIDWQAPETARACPRHGPGFIELPGTSTCVRIGGRVATDLAVSTRPVANRAVRGVGTSARIDVEARADTPLGPARLVWSGRAATGASAFPGRPGGP